MSVTAPCHTACCSVIGRAASRLAPLLRALRRQPPPSQGGAPDVAVPLYMQAACHVMELCLHLAPECGVSSEAQLQLAQAAISCLVTSGRTALTLAPAGSGLGFGSAASGSQLHHVALVQLQFAAGHISTPGFPAAAAAAAAPPAQFAAWLSTVVGQLKRLGQERSTGDGVGAACRCTMHQLSQQPDVEHVLNDQLACIIPLPSPAAAAHQRSLLPAFVYLCHLVCRDPAWAAHAAALAQPALAADAVQLCLSLLSILAVVLPLPEERRPDICTWATVAQLASVLREEGVLHAPLASHLHAADSGSASAAVAAAAQLMHLLPVSVPPPGFAVAAHEGLALAAIDILSVLCAPFYDEPAALSRWSIQQRQRVVAQLLPAVSQLPALLQLVAGRRQVAELDAVEQGLLLDVVRAACKQLVLLRDLSDKGTAGDGQQRGPLPASVEDAAAWCSAACSTLRCVPLVQQLYSAHSSRGEPAVFCELVVQTAWFAATAAAQVLASLLHDGLEAAVLRAANAGLFGALWQLHTQLARLVHFAAIADGPLDWLSGTQQYLTLAEALARCVVASRTLTCICEQADPADVALTTLTRCAAARHLKASLLLNPSARSQFFHPLGAGSSRLCPPHMLQLCLLGKRNTRWHSSAAMMR